MKNCSTCSNEWSCDTYLSCPNQFQTLSSGLCSFACSSGYFISKATCGSCSDSNCRKCHNSNGVHQCGLCQNNFYLDLATYTCVSTCGSSSQSIDSENDFSDSFKYCRPYLSNSVSYYIDSVSSSEFELGTLEHPFKILTAPTKEIFNWFSSPDLAFVVYIKSGQNLTLFQESSPLIFLNLNSIMITTYGSGDSPFIFIKDIPIQAPDSTWFSLAEESYSLSKKYDSGDLSASQYVINWQRIHILNSNFSISGLQLFTTFTADYLYSNYLISVNQGQGNSVYLLNSSFSVDGGIIQASSNEDLHVIGCSVNITSMKNAIYMVSTGYSANEKNGSLNLVNNSFFGWADLSNSPMIVYSAMGNVSVLNNSFTNLSIQTSPFVFVEQNPINGNSLKDQFVNIEGNAITQSSNFQIFIDFEESSLQNINIYIFNNSVTNMEISVELFKATLIGPGNISLAQNKFFNLTSKNYPSVYSFYSPFGSITMINESLMSSTLDEFLLIRAAESYLLSGVSLQNISGTLQLSDSYSLIKITEAESGSILQTLIEDCSFIYGSALFIEQSNKFIIDQLQIRNTNFKYSSIVILKLVSQLKISNLTFSEITTESTNYVISIPTILLDASHPEMEITALLLTNSSCSLLNIDGVILKNETVTANFIISFNNFTFLNNFVEVLTPFLKLGDIEREDVSVVIANLTAISNQNIDYAMIYSIMNVPNFTITDAFVFNNTGTFLFLEQEGFEVQSSTFIKNSNFSFNNGMDNAIIQIANDGWLSVKNSSFSDNFSYGKGSILLAIYENTVSVFEDCIFQHNFAYQGGVFYVQSGQLTISNSSILQNYAVVGGVGYIDNDGVVTIDQNSTIVLNAAANTCILYVINTKYVTKLDSVVIVRNDQTHSLIDKNDILTASEDIQFVKLLFFEMLKELYFEEITNVIAENDDYALNILKASVLITFSSIYENDRFAKVDFNSLITLQNSQISNISCTAPLFQAITSSMILVNSLMQNITTDPNALNTDFFKIQILNKAAIQIKNSTIQQINGPLLFAVQSTVQITSFSVISNSINSDAQNPFFSLDTCQTQLRDSSMDSLDSENYPYLFKAYSNSLIQYNFTITNFLCPLFLIQYGTASFDTFLIPDGVPIIFDFPAAKAVMFEIFSANFTIKNSVINGIRSSQNSPVISMSNDIGSSSKSILTVTNCQFSFNQAGGSYGVIYSYFTDVKMSLSTFVNNSALNGDGGALYLECPKTVTCSYSISNSNFYNNSASVNGGAIKYTFYKPTITSVLFKNNSALYGPDIAAYPILLVYQALNKSNNTNSSNSSTNSSSNTSRILVQQMPLGTVKKLGFQAGNIFILEVVQGSGQVIAEALRLTLRDEFGNIVVTDNSTQATMAPYSPGITLLQQKTVQAVNGVINFDSVIIQAKPGFIVYCTVSSPSLDYYTLIQAYPLLKKQIPVEMYVQFDIGFCLSGQYESVTQICLPCPKQFYSLEMNQTHCQSCPEGATCEQGTGIRTIAGYWRESDSSSDVYACYSTDACLSSLEARACEVGYEGNLCDTCGEVNGTYYFRDTIFTCAPCVHKTANTVKIIAFLIVLLCYIFCLIFFSLRNSTNNQPTIVYLRILTNYFQMLMLVMNFGLHWTSAIQNFMTNLSYVGSSQNSLLSFDCFIKESQIKIPPQFVKIIVILAFPALFTAVMILFWLLFWVITRSAYTLKYLLHSVTIVIYLVIPSISYYSLSIFSCAKVFPQKNRTFTIQDLSIPCWEDQHSYYAQHIAIPAVVVWLFILPVILYVYLMRNKDILQSPNFRIGLGYFVMGLRKNYFLWEIFLYVQKTTIIIINIFLSPYNTLFKVSFSLTSRESAASLFFMSIWNFCRASNPMSRNLCKTQNSTQILPLQIFWLIFFQFSIFYCGLFLLTDSLPSAVAGTLFFIIVISNVVFYLYLIRCLFDKLYTQIKNKLSEKMISQKQLSISQVSSPLGVDGIDKDVQRELEEHNLTYQLKSNETMKKNGLDSIRSQIQRDASDSMRVFLEEGMRDQVQHIKEGSLFSSGYQEGMFKKVSDSQRNKQASKFANKKPKKAQKGKKMNLEGEFGEGKEGQAQTSRREYGRAKLFSGKVNIQHNNSCLE